MPIIVYIIRFMSASIRSSLLTISRRHCCVTVKYLAFSYPSARVLYQRFGVALSTVSGDIDLRLSGL